MGNKTSVNKYKNIRSDKQKEYDKKEKTERIKVRTQILSKEFDKAGFG